MGDRINREHFIPTTERSQGELTQDESDLVATELFGQMLVLLKGTASRDSLANFMLPDSNLEDNATEEVKSTSLEELKKYLITEGIATNRELDEKIQVLIKTLPDLKLGREMNIATWQRKTLKFLGNKLGINPSEEE